MSDTEPTLERVVSVKKLPALAISRGGTLIPKDWAEVITIAQYLSKAGENVPKHLRENPAMCMGVVMDASAWGLNPFRLATQHMVVNGIGSYMSQAITAAINQSTPIKGKLVPRYEGEGDNLRCILEPTSQDGQTLPYESPPIKDISPKNSPLWKTDVRQQLFYFSARAWCRRYYPELLMGAYDPEEARSMRDITPAEEKPVVNHLMDDEEAPKPVEGEVLPPPHRSGLTQVNDRDESERLPPQKPSVTISPDGTLKSMDLSPGAHGVIVEEPKLTPAEAIIAEINVFTDGVKLTEWQHANQVRVNSFKGDEGKAVRKAISDKHLELDTL